MAEQKLAVAEAVRSTGMTPQRVCDLRKRLEQPEEYRAYLLGSEYVAACLEGKHVRGTFGTGENEWFTPHGEIALAREVLGEIDLDPATHEQAQQIVRASRYFTKDDDGLKHDWHGRVWLNPPYSQPLVTHFADKLCRERNAGRVTAAIMLTHNYTETIFFQQAAKHCDAICFPDTRIRFHKPDGTRASPAQGQAFHYFGDDIERFVSVFGPIGFIARPL